MRSWTSRAHPVMLAAMETALSPRLSPRHLLVALVIAPVVCGVVALTVLLLNGFALVLGPVLAGIATYLYARRSLIPSRAWVLAGASAVLAIPAVLAWMLVALELLLGDGFAGFE